MPNVFLIADLHFGHQGVCKFLKDDGSKLRHYQNADEMDEDMVQRWNSTVGAKDKVYVLGDVAMRRQSLSIIRRLNGDKVLIKGNHDIYKLNDYSEHFRDVRAYHVMNGLILSHIPLHEESLGGYGCNIHGHLHYRQVMCGNENGKRVIDPRYFCVSVEQIDYTPIRFESVLARIREQGGHVGFKLGNAKAM